MAGRTLTSNLVVRLIDRVRGPAKGVTSSLHGIGDAARNVNKIGVSTRLSAAISRNNNSLASMRGRLLDATAAGYALSRAIGSPIASARRFQDAMKDVQKVVNFDTPEGFAKFQADLKGLSKRLPVAVNGLAEIAAAAGQMGIARDDILKFTETAAKIGVAFDIPAKQAGESIAKLMTGLDLTLDRAVLLSDGMNHLSNNMATSASEVLDVVRNVGAQGKQYGYAGEEVAAFGAAMVAAGAESNVASTSFRNMGRALTRGASATKRQRQAFQQLGLDATNVAKRMQDDAVGTTVDVLERIQQLPKEMQAAVSSDLFGNEARALGPLLTNLDLVREALGYVGDESKYAGSAFEEYGVRADSFSGKVQKFQNKIEALKIGIGNALMPALSSVMDAIAPMITGLSDLAQRFPEVTAVVVGGAAALIAFKVAAIGIQFAGLNLKGSLLTMGLGITRVGMAARWSTAMMGRPFVGAFREANGVLQTMRMRTELATKATGKAPGAFARAGDAAIVMGRSFGRLLNPLRLVRLAFRGLKFALISTGIGAIVVAIGTAGAWIMRNWDGIREMFVGIGEGIKEAFPGAADAIDTVADAVGSLFGWFEKLTGPVDASKKEWRDWGREIGRAVGGALADVRALPGKAYDALLSGAADLYSAGGRLMQSLWDGLKAKIASVMEWVRGIPERIAEIIGDIDISGMVRRQAQSAVSGIGSYLGLGSGDEQKRAAGGPTLAGRTYLVGEEGPELWRSPSNGSITPNGETMAALAATGALAAAGGGGRGAPMPPVSMTFNPRISIEGGGDPQAIVDELIDRVSEEMGERLGEVLRRIHGDWGG